MQWLNNMTVGRRLALGFSIMILFMAGIGLVGYGGAGQIWRDLEDIFKVRLPSIDFLVEADRDLQQLLVAERSIIFISPKSKAFKSQIGDYEKNLKQSQDRWNKFKALAASPAEKEIILKFERAREEWKAVSRKVVDVRLADTDEGKRLAMELTMGEAGEKFEAMRDYLDQLQEITLKGAASDEKKARGSYGQVTWLILAVSGLGVIIGALLAFFIGRGITKKLKVVIEDLTQSSEQVAAASGEVSRAGQSLAQGSSEQASSLEETSASLEEMASMTKQNAENAGQADGMMKEAGEIVGRANSSMKQLRQAMDKINTASDETAKIIKTIDEIAFQTNLLALNAAVEAARAGEAGAGFAVVADEVRNLAMRAAEAAKNTSALIEENIGDIKSGSQLVVSTDEVFQEVLESAAKVGELVGEIAAASGEQSQGIDQINGAMSQMDKVTQSNAANAEESAAAAEELSAQAETMKGFVGNLAMLVGGSGNKSQAPPKGALRRKDKSPAKLTFEPGKAKQEKQNQPAPKKPEEAIPLTDDEFEDF
jgi:methyl-accepting chemotaxis protein